MLVQILLGCLMIGATTVIHGGFMIFGVEVAKRLSQTFRRPLTYWTTGLVVSVFIVIMFVAAVVEVWLWSLLYLATGALQSLETAVYFSTTTFSTLGYGDIVLGPQWRLLSSFEAVNGIILFGWTTALVFQVVQRAYSHDHTEARPRWSA